MKIRNKARNPANQAGHSELALLEQFQQVLTSGQKANPIIRTNASGDFVYYAPILVNNPLCLNCHGQPNKDIQPSHLAVIQELYPQDAATGFKLGDLRGMWRIQFPRNP